MRAGQLVVLAAAAALLACAAGGAEGAMRSSGRASMAAKEAAHAALASSEVAALEGVRREQQQAAAAAASSSAAAERRVPCPGNGCSGHGSCNTATGQCSCTGGYTGSDCSYKLTALTSGTKVSSQNVAQGTWNFYSVTTTAGSGLTVVVNQTSGAQDADMYLKSGSIPSFSSYEYREIGTEKNFELTVDNAGSATWYIGVYGYLATDFAITATVGSRCPNRNNCNGHGTCVGPDTCACASGYVGQSCESTLRTLAFGSESSSRVELRQWNYYQLVVPSGKTLLQLFVRQTTAGGDVDMYVKKGSLPRAWDYDYRDVSLNPNFNISVANPAAGTYYIGIYGFAAGAYALRAADSSDGCPSQCSGTTHGTCNQGQCLCKVGYSGQICETKNGPISVGSAASTPWESGFVDDNVFNYYHTQPLLATRTVAVQVKQIARATSAPDCDLYVRKNSAPTRFQYDLRHIGLQTEFNVTINDPAGAEWYIGVYGYGACQYQVRAIETGAGCPGACSGHGQCMPNGECSCAPGYSGSDCSTRIVTLGNGQNAVAGSVGPNSWKYYSLALPSTASSYFAISLKETTTSGDVWIFASKANDVPTLTQNEYASQGTNTPFHNIHAEVSPASGSTPETWIVGVYGSPLIASGSQAGFKIAGWAPPF